MPPVFGCNMEPTTKEHKRYCSNSQYKLEIRSRFIHKGLFKFLATVPHRLTQSSDGCDSVLWAGIALEMNYVLGDHLNQHC